MRTISGNNYVFIPGKNWRLSLAELVSFLDTKQRRFVILEFSREFFDVNISANNDSLRIDSFGGIIKIGVVKATFSTTLTKAFVRNDKIVKKQIKENITSSGLVREILDEASGKILFGVSVYCADRSLRGASNRIQRFAGSAIKDELAAAGVKSDFMGFSGKRQFPQLSHVEVLKKQLVEKKAEVLLCVGREQTLIATTIAVHNPFEFQKRDIEKPVERRIFAIPPRLARIMVNLAGCTTGKTFLDPFCGVGTILQEALLSESHVVGVDLNPWCVKAAKENLEWLTKEYDLRKADFVVLQGDARKLSSRVRNVDCIATEPDLGPALRYIPTNTYAAKIVAKLEPLYFEFLKDAYNMLNDNGRLVMVTPYFQTRSGDNVATRFVEKAEEVGFKRVFPFRSEFFEKSGQAEQKLVSLTSLVDVAEWHKVGREIHILQKAH